MTVPVIACISRYVHVRARTPAQTYVIHANDVLTKIMVCDATNLTFHTCHWYSYEYTDVPRPSRFTCEGLALKTNVDPVHAITDKLSRLKLRVFLTLLLLDFIADMLRQMI